MRLLLIDDDDTFSTFLTTLLRREGLEVERASDGWSGLRLFERCPADLVILDIQMPGISGFEVLRRLREEDQHVPILILTSRLGVADLALALGAGADDYLRKPFDTLELVARIRALRRRGGWAERGTLTYGDLELDQFNGTATRGGRRLRLTPTEFRILRTLMLRSGEVVSKEELREEALAMTFDPGTNVLGTHVSNLRKKLEAGQLPRVLESVRGVGYRLS